MAHTTQSELEYFKKKEHYLEVINQFAITLLDAKSVDDILWAVAKNAIAQLGYIDCVIYLYDEAQEVLIQKAAHGPKNPIDLDILNPINIKIGEGIVGHVAKTQQGEIISDTSTDPRYILDGQAGLSEIAVPIIHNKKIIGVIDSEHTEKNFFPEDDLKILTTIASMTAAKLVQAFYDQKLQEYQNDLKELVHVRTKELNKTLTELKTQTLELTDSISYAQRIQKAILRHPASIKDLLPESLFIYKPKDSIGGDFYLAEKIGDKIVFAVADCTGHGVPGAIISVVCGNALKRAIREVGLHNSAKILEQTREYVIETFEGSDEDIKDGMDIALCILDPVTYQLNYAGANISLYYIQKHKLLEIKPDKQPIGNYVNKLPFTNHTLQLQQNDSVYVFTDGMPDQFGGPRGKKFNYKQLRELIHSSQHYTMHQLGELLDTTFEEWKGDLMQVDDVCVLGIKLT
ncbi:MAG: SpoIIE family protein phosphatase [Bacteroidetes bacterium]|nr:SpoIIE family protein phosphatase [Bacteroidota bacterium]